MRQPTVRPTGTERFFSEDEIIVSKTDAKGRVTYANRTFLEISGFTEEEILGQPHSIIRHPDMPRCVFHLLWETIKQGREIFAYVINMSKNGDHYWVFAHVTPTLDPYGHILGYHSNRRVPERKQVELFASIYQTLLSEEQKYPDWHAGMQASAEMLKKTIAARGMQYEEFVFSV